MTVSRPSSGQGRLSILVVCTGNICRSPVAERLLRASLGSSVRIASAGTYAMVGSPIEQRMAALLRGAGADAEAFAARQLTEDHVRSADLVLGMTRELRAVAVSLWPASVRHSFTFTEWSRLLAEVDPGQLPVGDAATRLAAAIPLAAGQRHRLEQSPELDDILDPYRGSAADSGVAFSAIAEAAAVMASRT